MTLGGRTVSGAEVVQDDLARAVTPIPIGTFPPGTRVDGYHRLANGDQLLSFDVTVSLPGGVTAGPADLLRFNGSTYTLFFDGKAAGVPAGLDLDAAHYLESSGLLLLSFGGSGSLGGVTFGKADVLDNA